MDFWHTPEHFLFGSAILGKHDFLKKFLGSDKIMKNKLTSEFRYVNEKKLLILGGTKTFFQDYEIAKARLTLHAEEFLYFCRNIEVLS